MSLHYWSTINMLLQSHQMIATKPLAELWEQLVFQACLYLLQVWHFLLQLSLPMDHFICYENCMAFLYDIWKSSKPGEYCSNPPEEKLRDWFVGIGLSSKAHTTFPASVVGLSMFFLKWLVKIQDLWMIGFVAWVYNTKWAQSWDLIHRFFITNLWCLLKPESLSMTKPKLTEGKGIASPPPLLLNSSEFEKIYLESQPLKIF